MAAPIGGRALVYGVAIAGRAVIEALLRRGYEVVAADDQPTDDKVALARELGVPFVASPDAERIGELVAACDFVAPAPGVPEHHQLIVTALAAGRPLRTEIDLAAEWEARRPQGARPMIAVTGTDGKTTTTLMANAMLRSAGFRSEAVGNTDVPLVEALDTDADAFVVECSSFRLNWTYHFRPRSAVWLNLAPDHLNWHRDIDAYIAAKARIWKFQQGDDTAIGWIDDDTVMAHLAHAPARRMTFGRNRGEYHLANDNLVGPDGVICSAASMRRSLPHDVTNALAAAALVSSVGLASYQSIAEALATFVGPPHRIEPVGERNGVRWYNDSKATSPHAALTAIRGFDSLVLIAGGRNKGLDLSSLGSEPQRMRAVVAIGDSATDIAAAFAGICQVVTASSMSAAVAAAADLARAGDAVVLSPACTSFDWYNGYPARGDDFRRCVDEFLHTIPEGKAVEG